MRFFATDPRTCRGTLLGRKTIDLDPGEDLTIVATKKAPRIVTFSNAGLGEIPPLGAPAGVAVQAMRHAADLTADFRYRFWVTNPPVPINPAGTFAKGAQQSFSFGPPMLLQLQATNQGTSDVIASSPMAELVVSHRYEFILVGSTAQNERIVLLDRVVSQPRPDGAPQRTSLPSSGTPMRPAFVSFETS